MTIDPFRNTNLKRQVDNKYDLLDSGGAVVVSNEGNPLVSISIVEFCLFIEAKTLEEASQYVLVPC